MSTNATTPGPEPRAQTLVIAAGAVFALTAMAVYARLYFGTDFSDESFYVALPYAFSLGHRPLQDEISVHQFGGLMLLPAIKLYLAATKSPEGLLLFARHLYFAYALLCAALVVRYFRALVGLAPALLLGAVSIAYVPFSIASLSYNTLASFGLRAGLVEIAISLRSRRPLLDLGAGSFLLTSATLAYPPLGVVSVPALAYATLLLARRLEGSRALHAWATTAIAALLVLGPMLAALVASGNTESLSRLLEFGDAYEAQGGGRLKLARIAYEFYVEAFYLIALGLLVAAVVALHHRVEDRRVAAALLGLACPALFAVSWLYVRFNEPNSTTTFVLSAFGLYALIGLRRLREADWSAFAAELRLLVVASLAAGVLIVWASANGLRNAALGLLPAALVGLAFLCGARSRGGTDRAPCCSSRCSTSGATSIATARSAS